MTDFWDIVAYLMRQGHPPAGQFAGGSDGDGGSSKPLREAGFGCGDATGKNAGNSGWGQGAGFARGYGLESGMGSGWGKGEGWGESDGSGCGVGWGDGGGEQDGSGASQSEFP